MRGATGVTIQPHQILRLSRRKTRIRSPHHIWNLIYNARSNQCLPTNSPNTAPATQNDHLTCGTNARKTSETSFPMRGRSEHDPSMIREWSEHENANRNPPGKWGYFSRSPGAFSIVKYNVSSPILHSNIHQVLRLPQKVTLDLHRILPLPRKVTLDLHRILPLPRKVTCIVHPCDIWSLIYNARSNQCLPRNSPNTAPATQNDHLTCGRNVRKTSETSFPMRGRSEHDPRMIRAWKRKPQPAWQVRLLFEVPRSTFYCKIQRFEPNLTFKHSPSAAPATKSNTWPSRNTAPTTTSNTWPSPNTAPATQSNTWPSPNTAPTTKVTLLYLTLLYWTLLYLILLDTTLIDLTWLYSTWLYSTWHYSNWLNLTLL